MAVRSLAIAACVAPAASPAQARDAAVRATHPRSCWRSGAAPRYPGVGYFYTLTVANASCATGYRLAIAYYRCRLRGGGPAGRCRGPVLGFTCRETRRSIAGEFDARVTCWRPHQTVVHTYQEGPL